MTWLITPEQTLSAARQAGLGDGELKLGGVAVLTFSKAVVDWLQALCGLEDTAWITPYHHPYAAAEIVKRGAFEGIDVTVLVPPMGASPLACIVEDLVACGVQAIFLVCAAWSLGSPVQFGDLIVPAFSVGPDGTSIHYGNTSAKFTLIRSWSRSWRRPAANGEQGCMWAETRPVRRCIALRHRWRRASASVAACAWRTARPARCSL